MVLAQLTLDVRPGTEKANQRTGGGALLQPEGLTREGQPLLP